MDIKIKDFKYYEYLNILSYGYILFITISLTLVSKLIPIQIPLTSIQISITGATVILPFAFFIQNIITENYGYVRSRKLTQISMVFLIIYVFIINILSNFPYPKVSSSVELINKCYPVLFNALPVHLYGLLIAVFVCSLSNDFFISKSKILFSGKYLGGRFIGAVIIGELFPHFVSIVVWWGVLDFWGQILPLVVFSYAYKIFFEIATTPLNYVITGFLKNKCSADTYDIGVKYNPFIWK